MPRVIRVALSGYNALTDTDPSHFSLYVDGTTNHILVKEHSRGTQAIASGDDDTITHSLGYFPSAAVMAEISSGEFQHVFNANPLTSNEYFCYVTTAGLVIYNAAGSTKTFTYIIFYDQL
jgi:hypothetical protein